MRKNLLFTALAATTLLLATSCQQDEVFVDGNETVVTFEVGTPEIATRAFSQGEKATKLQWAVYDESNTPVVRKENANAQEQHLQGTATLEGGKASVNISLAAGKTYKVLFWADAYGNAQDGAYKVDFDNLKMDVNYVGAVCNDESRDAFFKYVEVAVGQANETKEVKLTRPFAQLNIGTDDLNKLDGVSADQTQVKVNVYDQLDLKTGFVTTGATATAQTFKFADRPTNETFPVDGYKYLAMNYLLVGKDKTVVDVEFSYGADAATAKTRTYTGIPVQPNYRTNIYGSLLTQGIDFDVTIDPDYNGNQGQDVPYVTLRDANNNHKDNYKTLAEALAATDATYNTLVLNGSMETEAISIKDGKTIIIDLNGNSLSATSTTTGKNYNMIDVSKNSTLTIKNGTIEYKHTGENMAWNNSTNIFNVTAGGVLNLDGVTAKNLGGSDMAFVAHLNNWGEVTLNVNNSTLESTYIPVRVFNSGNDMNNVTIKETTLKGKYCFWVHNYTLADFGNDQAKVDAHKALLNFDIFNSENGESNNNTFTCNNAKNAPVLYGFTDAVYFDEFGNEILDLEEIADGVYVKEGYNEDNATEFFITNDKGLAWVAANVGAKDGFAGKTIKLNTDVDMDLGNDENGEPISNNPIGRNPEDGEVTAFKGTFDGQGHTIANLYQSGWAFNYEWGQYGSLGLFAKLESATVKNVVIEGLEAQVEGGDISFIAGSATGNCVFENITINNSSIGTYNNGCGGIIGWSGAGTYTFKNITIGSDVVLGGLWGSFDSSIGGIVGQAEPGASYHFEDVEISCRLDVYNDVTAAYKYYIYRMCGMIIGRCEETTTIDGSNYPDLSKYNITCKNVTVNYGDWMNYHYCVVEGKTAWRVEPGYAYGGVPADHDHSTCAMHHNLLLPFDGLFGGDQYGVKPIKEYPGVTVNYPASYTPEN